jgi:hypothetical protein
MSARRLSTLLAVALVAAVTAAAVVDAFRAGPEPAVEPAASTAAREPESQPDVARAVAALREAGVTGILVASIPGCRVELVTLPDLGRRTLEVCAELTASGRLVTLDGRVPSPANNTDAAWCAEPEKGVLVERGPTTYGLPGCAPAWRPDGLLTVVYEGELRGVAPPDRLGARLLSRRDLRRLFDPGLPRAERRSLEVVEVAWTSETRFTAILRKPSEPRYLLAVFEPGRLLPAWRCCFGELEGLRTSPRRGYLDVRADQGRLVFSADGGFLPIVIDARRAGVAFSPDDVLVAVAREGSVDILDPNVDGIASVARIPLEAVDVRWIASERDLVYADRN